MCVYFLGYGAYLWGLPLSIGSIQEPDWSNVGLHSWKAEAWIIFGHVLYTRLGNQDHDNVNKYIFSIGQVSH